MFCLYHLFYVIAGNFSSSEKGPDSDFTNRITSACGGVENENKTNIYDYCGYRIWNSWRPDG